MWLRLERIRAALAGVGFLVDHLHADATHHVLAALHRGELHVLLVGLDAGLESAQRGAVRAWNHDRPLGTLFRVKQPTGKAVPNMTSETALFNQTV